MSDRIGAAPLLRIDEVHHKIALFPSAFPGVQHINHQVDGIDDVMRAFYVLQEHGVRILFGPGRHPTSGAVFLYFVGPDDMIYEYSTGVRLITRGRRAHLSAAQLSGDPLVVLHVGLQARHPRIQDLRSTGARASLPGSRQSSKIATARVQPAEAPRILCGKQVM